MKLERSLTSSNAGDVALSAGKILLRMWNSVVSKGRRAEKEEEERKRTTEEEESLGWKHPLHKAIEVYRVYLPSQILPVTTHLPIYLLRILKIAAMPSTS
ncbi:hypothetical protein ONZ45_g12738 [Pleurotus djamor]|nr:hypothetical protein ONZ45_g12738 [Pleurotus djamor]